MIATCLVLAGGAACAGGGAPLSQTLTLLVGGLVAVGLGGLTLGGCRAQTARGSDGGGADRGTSDDASSEAGDGARPDVPAPFTCGAGSQPPATIGTAGWVRCCLGTQIRACPMPPPTVACNYGWNETYCSDGITCGLTWLDPCGTGTMDGGGSDSSTDSASDAGTAGDAPADAIADVAPVGDGATDAFLGCGVGSIPATDGGMPAGWIVCCMSHLIRWCPPQPPNVACNYGQGQTFCPDGITCGLQTENACGTIDGGAVDGGGGPAEVGP